MNLFSRRKLRKQATPHRAMQLGAILGITASLGFAARYIYRHLKETESRAHVENSRDKSLRDSFPASDPPASQYFDIPANRV